MPRLDGITLLEMMNQKGIHVPVLFLTADTNPEMEAKSLEIGAVDYIQKPLKKESFLLRVKKALA
jgi:DNA-binding response OmpR family regulator